MFNLVCGGGLECKFGCRYAIVGVDDPEAFTDGSLDNDPTFKEADTDIATFRAVFPAHQLPDAFVVKAACVVHFRC
jgi:hypothetical protein